MSLIYLLITAGGMYLFTVSLLSANRILINSLDVGGSLFWNNNIENSLFEKVCIEMHLNDLNLVLIEEKSIQNLWSNFTLFHDITSRLTGNYFYNNTKVNGKSYQIDVRKNWKMRSGRYIKHIVYMRRWII